MLERSSLFRLLSRPARLDCWPLLFTVALRLAYGIEIPTEIYELEDMQTIIKEDISLVDL